MTIKQIHQLAIKMGIKADLRSKSQIQKALIRLKKKYQGLPEQKKKEFDTERLTNPYPDTRILIDKPGKQIKTILAGIDIGVGEVLLADRLGKIDLLLAHHPEGIALANLDEVMKLQADLLALYGIPINIAESLLKLRRDEVSRKVSPINLYETIDAAKLLDFGFICCHTACDNLVAGFLDQKISAQGGKAKPETVGEILDLLKKIPEYAQAVKMGFGPRIFVGSEDNRVGKVVLNEVTGGTSGSKKIYEKMAQAGVGTIIGMHMSEEHRKEAEKSHINVIIAGHMASDSLGMNLFLDELEKKGIKVIPCSGLIRVKRMSTTKVRKEYESTK